MSRKDPDGYVINYPLKSDTQFKSSDPRIRILEKYVRIQKTAKVRFTSTYHRQAGLFQNYNARKRYRYTVPLPY